jgi:catechol 2,3-dioxygenase-like lactoylglutathione lyase family enzyme
MKLLSGPVRAYNERHCRQPDEQSVPWSTHLMRRHRSLVALGVGLALCGADRPGPCHAEERAHFHHVRLNVTDVARSMRFYERVFGAVPVKFQGVADALFTERSFILFNRVSQPPPSALTSAIWHIGWGGVDVKGEYEWWKRHAIPIHTPLSPLPGPDNYYFYVSGPDKELIEINTMGHHRFAHVHLFATDVNDTTDWYAKHLGLEPRRKGRVPRPAGDMATLAGIWINSFRCDNVSLIVFGKPDRDPPPPWWRDPPLRALQPTQGRVIDHLAFSYRAIEPVFERMKQAGVKVVRPIGTDPSLKLKSFFVLAPDDVLVEIVEAKPVPEGLWDDPPGR